MELWADQPFYMSNFLKGRTSSGTPSTVRDEVLPERHAQPDVPTMVYHLRQVYKHYNFSILKS
jgi:hypothetical protein